MAKYEKGTHGVLTNSNSGVSIPATVRESHDLGLYVVIDGVARKTSTNYFLFSDGWSFKPDLVLPMQAGSVVEIGNEGGGHARWMLMRNGTWVSEDGNERTPDQFRDFIKRGHFDVRELS